MQPVTFLFLAFGENTNNHIMGTFAILSIQKYSPKNCQILIYTDKAQYYSFFGDKVSVRNLDEKTLKDWRGSHDFLWRIKIKAMLDSATTDSGHLVYLDMDTYAKEDLTSFFQKLDSGISFMHEKENLLCLDSAKNKQLMWSQTQGKKYSGMLVDKTTSMWNAGLVALPSHNKVKTLESALLCNDEMCEQNVERWLIEQFSLSLALNHTGNLEEGAPWFVHYWGTKEPTLSKINEFLSIQLLTKATLPQILEQINKEQWLSHEKPKPNSHNIWKQLKYFLKDKT